MATWRFVIEGDAAAIGALGEAYPDVVVEEDGRWLLLQEAPYDAQSRDVRRTAADRIDFLAGSSLTDTAEIRLGNPIGKEDDAEGRRGKVVSLSPGSMRWGGGGIKMLLHHRATEILGTTPDIPDLAAHFPKARFWLPNYLLNSKLRGGFGGSRHAVILALIRRASHALSHYQEGREATLEFAAWDGSGALPASTFFGAIEAWENCLVQTQMGFDLLNKRVLPKGQQVFDPKDGSVAQRIYDAANTIKHSGRRPLSEADVTPLWLEADGVGSLDGHRLTFVEVAEAVRDAAEFAELYQDPAAAVEAHAASGGSSDSGPVEGGG